MAGAWLNKGKEREGERARERQHKAAWHLQKEGSVARELDARH
jgi:hypothetical protein